MWVLDYLEKEVGAKVYRSPHLFNFHGKNLLVGHGDGLGPGDKGYKFIKKVFANPFLQWSFARIHPNTGIRIADYFSRKSRAKTGEGDSVFTNKENEWLYQYACEYQKKNKPVDYFIFGHRHLPLNIVLPEKGVYYNLGDWIKYYTYGVLANGEFSLKVWED
jgi:UDP-2,3-diacylglucosamine hydrolase